MVTPVPESLARGLESDPLSWVELGGMGWSGFGAVTILVTKHRFGASLEKRSSRNSLILLCPGWDSNPHEGNPHRILSPVRFIRDPYLSKVSVLPLTQCSPKLLNLKGLEANINWFIYQSEG